MSRTTRPTGDAAPAPWSSTPTRAYTHTGAGVVALAGDGEFFVRIRGKEERLDARSLQRLTLCRREGGDLTHVAGRGDRDPFGHSLVGGLALGPAFHQYGHGTPAPGDRAGLEVNAGATSDHE